MREKSSIDMISISYKRKRATKTGSATEESSYAHSNTHLNTLHSFLPSFLCFNSSQTFPLSFSSLHLQYSLSITPRTHTHSLTPRTRASLSHSFHKQFSSSEVTAGDTAELLNSDSSQFNFFFDSFSG